MEPKFIKEHTIRKGFGPFLFLAKLSNGGTGGTTEQRKGAEEKGHKDNFLDECRICLGLCVDIYIHQDPNGRGIKIYR